MRSKLERLELQIPMTHNHLPHIVQAVPHQLRWICVSFGVILDHLLADDIEALQLVHHRDCEGSFARPQVNDPVPGCDCCPFGATIVRVQVEVFGVVEGHEDCLPLYGPDVGVVIPDIT